VTAESDNDNVAVLENRMNELPKAYDPSLVEDKWYVEWLKQGCFTADPTRAFNGHGLSEPQKAAERAKGLREAYSIVIPPPNVTGILHMGHVLNNTIQDILSRRKRMQGYEVLWLPGIDHAGIATQAVVERQLKKEEKKSRHDLGREEFLKRVWTWKDKHGGIILQQLKKLGCSCDWSRTVFTMDGLDPRDPNPRINYSKWVAYVFVQLYQKGLIYRGRRMVNWCVVSHTALSDEEVIMKESKGSLWHLRYPLVENPEQNLVVATTRPETMLGDTAVAVNPKDDRYRSLIGKKLRLPLVGREIPIIADELVDPQFGTGCVKVTPAHDPADFQMGQRHHLEQIQVIGFNGKMTEAAGVNYVGLDRYECREKVVADLQELGLVEKIDPYTHNVGYSERADVPAEPMVSDQWFLKYPATRECLDSVLTRKIAFWPDRWAKVFEHWITNIQDWCISRQLWWGHRIPVWTRGSGEKAETYVGLVAPQGEGWVQDPDVLDTWFSSWLWPFATMISDPENLESESKDSNSAISKFYPTQDLATAPEILFFWVARMMMAGFEFKKERPFDNVYFNGTVRDKIGRKMSKSLGNSPDPLDLIAKYGADALRFGTMRCAPLGLDVRFDEQQVELGRNFCNKLWNAVRLRLSQTGVSCALSELGSEDLSSDDRTILMKLDQAIQEMDRSFEGYELNQVTARLYELFWTDYCDWYLEASKAALYGSDERAKKACLATMDHVLHHILRLLHPFMPFITEELWQALGFSGIQNSSAVGKAMADRGSSIQFAQWPVKMTEAEAKRLGLKAEVLDFVKQKYEAVSSGRNLKASYNIPGNKKVRFLLKPEGVWSSQPREVSVLKTLLNAESLEFVSEAPKGAASAVTALGILILPLEGLVDVEAECKRLTGQIAKLQKEWEQVNAKLADTGFTSRAPQEAVAKHRARAESLQGDIQKIQKQIELLG
jgi:valyl-tRNA synthetase